MGAATGKGVKYEGAVRDGLIAGDGDYASKTGGGSDAAGVGINGHEAATCRTKLNVTLQATFEFAFAHSLFAAFRHLVNLVFHSLANKHRAEI